MTSVTGKHGRRVRRLCGVNGPPARFTRGDPAERLDPRHTEPDETVLILGYGSSPRGRLSLRQRWRTRIVVRCTDVSAAQFVFTGGPTRGRCLGHLPHGRLTAVNALGAPGRMSCSRSAHERPGRTSHTPIPLIEQAPSIKIASNTFHARRARKHLAKQSPVLAARLHRAPRLRSRQNCD